MNRITHDLTAALLLCVGISASASPIEVKSGAPVPPCVVNQLQEIIRVALATDQGVDTELTSLTDPVRLRVDKGDLRDAFRVAEAFFRKNFDRKRVKEKVETLATEDLSKQNPDGLRTLRVSLKHLRYAFVAFDESHEVPELLDEIITALGHVQDDIKNQKYDQAHQVAVELVGHLDSDSGRKLEKEIESFRPSSPRKFERWFKEQIKFIRDQAAAPDAVTYESYHLVRKTVARFQAIVESLEIGNPIPEVKGALDFLSRINSRMGGNHDGMVERMLQNPKRYNGKSPTRFDAQLRVALIELAKNFKIEAK